MAGQDERKIVLVTRETRLDELIARFNTLGQAQFYVEHLGADFGDYLAEHGRYGAAIDACEAALGAFGRVQRLPRRYLANFLFAASDIVVAVGPDGLVANCLKYLDGQRLVGVNPDPARWDGALLPFAPPDLPKVMAEELAGHRGTREVTMAKASLNNGTSLYAVNDLFIGRRTHVSARYTLTSVGASERQSSSGIIVSTGLGSTGWMRSVYAGIAGGAGAFMGVGKLEAVSTMSSDVRFLRFAVREPYPSRSTGASIVGGQIDAGRGFAVMSEMAEDGVIFSDGVEADFLEFNAGTLATVTVSERVGQLVI